MKRIEILILVFIIVSGLIIQYQYLNEFPYHSHEWAQSDHYALALNFSDDPDIFKPRTFLFNHQFPYNWTVESSENITAVDFPVHDYAVGLIMKITGNTSPWIFRFYTLLYSCIGLLFLYRLTFLITQNAAKSFFVLIFIITSPLFVSYQISLLPSIPSLSNCIIGLYFYFRFLKQQRSSDFNVAIFFLTLSALCRTTFLILFIAVLSLEFIRVLQKKDHWRLKLLPVILSVFSIAGYMLYNSYLRKTYGSAFLNYLIPPNNWEHAQALFSDIIANMSSHYFFSWHYIIIVVLCLTSLGWIFFKKDSQPKLNYLLVFTGIVTSGEVLFFIMMMPQFAGHDYYFIDSLFLPVIFLLILFLYYLPDKPVPYFDKVLFGISLLLCIPLFSMAIAHQKQIRELSYLNRVKSTITNFTEAEYVLDSLGIEKGSKILLIDFCAPNIPFILMDRKGFITMSSDPERIKNSLKWHYNYIVFQNDYFLTHIYNNYPEILAGLTKVYTNDRIFICRYSPQKIKQSLEDFLSLKNKTAFSIAHLSYDTLNTQGWLNINASDEEAFSGKYSGKLTSEVLYGLTYKAESIAKFTERDRMIVFSSEIFSEKTGDLEIAVSMSVKGRNIFFHSVNLKETLKAGEWSNVKRTFFIPRPEIVPDEIVVFVWNTGKKDWHMDDVNIAIY